MVRVFISIGLVAGCFAAIVPITLVLFLSETPLWLVVLICCLNLVACCCALALFLSRLQLRREVLNVAEELGVPQKGSSFEALTIKLLHELERKNRAFLPHLLERRITSKEELSRTLERIVTHAFRLLNAESAELALFDKESGMYHSSFVLGKPFRKSAQAMLSGASDPDGVEETVSPDVVIEPLAFGGTVLGSLRVGLRRGSLPNRSDRDIMNLLALQAGLAVINTQYTAELMRMKHVAEESVKVKTGFLANLSHEIRAPLGIMMNAVELVLDGLCGPVNADQNETLRMIKDNGAHLLELINDVLDYAKAESGKVQATKVDIVVADMLKDLLSVVRSQADKKSHKLVLRPCEEALTVHCDRRHFRQMMINLLTNAIKYTPDHGTIEVWAERAPGSKIKINVSDSGVGIDPADRAKVFSPFERIQHAYSIKQVGTGLGMPLTKKLAEVNGGSVDFSSESGKGSIFWLLLGAAEFSPTAVEDKKEDDQPRQGRGEMVLVLESDEGERKMLERHLSHLGYNVTAAASRSETIDLVRKRRFNLAILDNKLIDNPEEDVLRTIRENTTSARVPVVLLSSRAFVFDIEKYLKAGVDRCLTKPVSLKEISVICRELIDGDEFRHRAEVVADRIDSMAKEIGPGDLQ